LSSNILRAFAASRFNLLSRAVAKVEAACGGCDTFGMKFRVTGQNRDRGARQVLEFEAESKGAAERKALQAGMTVNRVEDISDGDPARSGVTPGGSMRARRGGGSGVLKLLIGIAILLGIAYALYRMGIIKI
jgi:hypothetical protein